jgi:hypothetical protein
MSTISERIRKEIEELAEASTELAYLASRSQNVLGNEQVQVLLSIASRTGQLIERLYGKSSQYQRNLDRVLGTRSFSLMHHQYYTHVAELAGIISGIESDIENGLLGDLGNLMRAEVFADLLEMAEHLHAEGYKDPAAVLIGAVLEDSLRKLATQRGVTVVGGNGRPMTIDPLNVALAKDGAYNPLVQKQITSWANLRNDAAHGHFARYDEVQVKHMLLFVQKFCADFLS